MKFRGQPLAQHDYGIFSENFVFFEEKIENFTRAKKFSSSHPSPPEPWTGKKFLGEKFTFQGL